MQEYDTMGVMGTMMIKFLLNDVVLDALSVPIWWYTEGLIAVLRFFTRNARYGANVIGIGIWAKALFKPMYGERSWQGRIVSFVMRLIVLLWDMVIYVILLVFLLLFVAFWVSLPPLIIWQITRSVL